MCKKAYARMWMIRRLKKLGANPTEMLDVFYKQIRCVLELAVAVWEPSITVAESNQIERVQKCAFYIILGEQYLHYENALHTMNSERLSDRRYKLCLKFAKKSEKHPRYQNWFCPAEDYVPTINTRSDKRDRNTKFKPVPTRTDRFKNSPVPYMTDQLNQFYAK